VVVEDSVPTTPVDNAVPNQMQKTDVVITEGNTQPDESENPKSSDEKEDDHADKTMDDNTDTEVVDVENFVP
ncbi:hypothetical protein A2U01_0109361, partial [Trifolium medium]|nr:hypothetical protein [Trifolium medium]